MNRDQKLKMSKLRGVIVVPLNIYDG